MIELMGKDLTQKGLGLSGIEERIRMLGGSVNIWSQKECGTRMEFQAPIK